MGQVRKQQASMTIIFSAMLCKLRQLQTCPIYKYQLHFYWHSWYQPRLAGIHNLMLSYTVKIQDTNSWLKVPISLSPGSNGFPWVYVWVDILLPEQVHPHIWLRKMKKKKIFLCFVFSLNNLKNLELDRYKQQCLVKKALYANRWFLFFLCPDIVVQVQHLHRSFWRGIESKWDMLLEAASRLLWRACIPTRER